MNARKAKNKFYSSRLKHKTGSPHSHISASGFFYFFWFSFLIDGPCGQECAAL